MKKYLLVITILSIGSFYQEVRAQNYFPLSVGNKYEFIERYFYPCPPYADNSKYFSAEIQDSIIYNAEVFYKYIDHNRVYYLKYDSTQQKLYIYNDFFHKKLAADFNLQNGEPFTSYITGDGLIYNSLGQSEIIVFGEYKTAWSMQYNNPNDNTAEKFSFVSGIGLYQDYWTDRCGPSELIIYDDLHYFSAIVNTQVYNPLNLEINLLTELNDRQIEDFPFYINISVNLPVPELLDSLYLYYQVVRNGSMIFEHQTEFNPTTFQAIVNLNSTILEVGDSVNLKIVATDSSIFLNRVSLPDAGYYTIMVIDTATSVFRQDENKFSFSLGQNFPNPFNPSTHIGYTIASTQYVTLKLYNILGQEITTLISEEKPAGDYSVQLDGSNLPGGIYFYQLNAGFNAATKKLIILK